jgi:hypothetical protein
MSVRSIGLDIHFSNADKRYFSNSNSDTMEKNNKEKTIKNAVGVAGGAVLLAPVGIPILHGLSGVAVVGLGLFAAGHW